MGWRGSGKRGIGEGWEGRGRGKREWGRGKREQGRGKREQGKGKTKQGRGKKEWERGKREGGRGKRELERGKREQESCYWMSRKFRIKDIFNRNRALLLLTFCPVSTWLFPACTTVEAFVLTISSDSSLIVSQACDSGGEVGHSLFTLSSLSPLHLLVLNTILIVLECEYNYRLNQPKQRRLQALMSLSKAFNHWLRQEEIKFTWLTVQPWIYALIPHCGPGHFVYCNC